MAKTTDEKMESESLFFSPQVNDLVQHAFHEEKWGIIKDITRERKGWLEASVEVFPGGHREIWCKTVMKPYCSAQTSEIQVTADFMKDLEESEIDHTPPILTTLQPVSLPSINPPRGKKRVFEDISESEVERLKEEGRNKNTSKKTMYEEQLFRNYAYHISGLDREMEDIPPEELNIICAKYFTQAKKVDGENYEPGTLKAHWQSLCR